MTNQLTQSALLVNLSITQYKVTMSDKSMKAKLVKDYQMTGNEAASAVKRLFTKASYKSVQSSISEIRDLHYKYTAPSGWKGPGILPSALYFDYTTDIDAAKTRAYQRVRAFAAELHQHKEAAQRLLGHAYNEKDYPDPQEFIDAFNVTVDFIPWPDSNQFATVKLLDDAADRLQKKFEARTQAQLAEVMGNFYRKLYDVVAAVSNKFAEEKKGMKIHETLIGNIREILPVLRKVNLNGSDELAKLADEVDQRLAKLEVSDLRDDEYLRKHAKSEADELLNKIGQFL